MTKAKPINFAELRELLHRLEFTEKSTDTAHIFHRTGKDLLAFRRYRDQDNVEPGDLVSTRRFLDAWGVLDAADFDSFLARTIVSA
jgi:hypothetical protein